MTQLRLPDPPGLRYNPRSGLYEPDRPPHNRRRFQGRLGSIIGSVGTSDPGHVGPGLGEAGGGEDKTPDFFSDWSYATGTGASAISDNSKWNGSNNNNIPLLTVVSAAGLGFPTGMTNVLRVLYDQNQDNQVQASAQWADPGSGQYIFFRLYVRNGFTYTSSLGGGGHHPLQSYIGACAYDHAWKWGLTAADPPLITSLNWQYAGGDYYLRDVGLSPILLPNSTTMRWEWRYYGLGSETYKADVRIYNPHDAGTATYDSSDFRSDAGGTLEGDDPTHDMSSDACIRKYFIGTNGPEGWPTSDLGYMYYGGFGVYISSAADDWIGAYGSLVGENA